MLKKLYHHGFRGKIWNVLNSYLKNRKICTKINQKISSLCKISYGIPQGPVLGPLLFLLFVNHLPNASKFKITLFLMMQICIFLTNNQNFYNKLVNEEIKSIDIWMKMNKLTLNNDKYKYMIVCGKPMDSPLFDLAINNVKIERTESIRYLKVQLDEKLSQKFYVENLKKKLSRTCRLIIFKLRQYVPLYTCRIIYYSMLDSIILYSLINWGRASNSLLRKIELLQNKFIRACLFQPRKTHVNLLFSKFQALKLKDMINMEFAKCTCKYKNQMLPSSFDNYFIKLKLMHNYNTRQKYAGGFFYRPINSEFGRKRLHEVLMVLCYCSQMEIGRLAQLLSTCYRCGRSGVRIPGRSNQTQSPTARHRCNASSELLHSRYAAEMDPATRYTNRCNILSMMKS